MRTGLLVPPTSLYSHISGAAAAFCTLVGLIVSLGWATGVYSLAMILPGTEPMRPNAAICFATAGVSLWLGRSARSAGWRRTASRFLAGFVLAVGGLTFLEYVLGLSLGIDNLPSSAGLISFPASVPPRMAANTSLSFALAAASLLLIDAGERRAQWTGQGLALSTGIIGLLAVVGYAYGVYSLTSLNPGIQMAVPTAVTFVVLAVGVLTARPEHGIMERITENTVGGLLLRRLLPVVVGLPLLLGWATILLQRSMADSGITDITMMAIVSAVVSFVVVWKVSRSIVRLDEERKMAQAALWESESRFRTAVEGSLDAFYILESVRNDSGDIADFRFVDANSRGENLVSTPREQLLGRNLCDLFPHNRTDGFVDRYVKVVETGEPLEEEFRISVPGIKASWLRHQVTRLHDGIVIISRDVTARVQAQLERERLSKDLGLLLESTDEGLYGIDVKGLCTFINASASRMIGYTKEEAAGKNMHDLIHHTCSSGRPYFIDECPIYQAFHERRGVRVDDEVFWRKDGTFFPVEYSSYPIVEDGVVKGAVVAFSDTTERKRAEDAIRTLNEGLSRRAAELAAANKELETFSYSVSHDLRSPLRSIDGFSQALLEDYGDSLDRTGKDYLSRVRAASQRMGTLIDDMLALSRLTRGEMHRTEVDLSEIAERIAGELNASEPGREVEFVIQPGLVADGDARLLTAVLQNLMGNAWKFTSQTGLARIEFGATQVDGTEAFFVRDNGAGFDMAYAGKLFGAFQRLHAANEFPGNGIGLATVQRIVHRHGGRVWAEGEVGKGATFYFSL